MEGDASVTEEFFRDRLRFLRNERKISAREMSLALGQNESYINKIETGKTSTTISSFLKICEYFGISPVQFFESGRQNTIIDDSELLTYFHRLTPKQSEYITVFLKDLTDR
ncbi:MAG: helix-turn-helix transcriptional regulator [Treponema sp.]|nr:helix-turn-helix transcriptional regulator [Treponema sp.]